MQRDQASSMQPLPAVPACGTRLRTSVQTVHAMTVVSAHDEWGERLQPDGLRCRPLSWTARGRRSRALKCCVCGMVQLPCDASDAQWSTSQ